MSTRTLAPLAAALLALAAPAFAGEMVEFENAMGQPTKGYLAMPEGDGKAQAILVVHEWWGLTDWVKQNADRFAEQGYIALAVDLYDGQATDDPGRAHELSRALDPGEGIADMKGGLKYLESHDRVGDGKVGAIGWCMGGLYSRLIAQNAEQVGPTVICYGSVTTEPEQVEKLAGKPVLGIFGAEDGGIPPAKVRQFAEALKGDGGTIDLHIYDGAGHAFMRPGGPSYVEEAADDAWKQIDTFFAEHLKK